jgi:hypothetical protein
VVSVTSVADFAITRSVSVTGVFAVVSGMEARVYGNLRFLVATSSVMENAGAATVWVIRTNGLNDAVSVDYFTSNGTAIAGSDYTAATGTVSFGHGVASNSFSVPITEDAIFEHDETLNLFLNNPGGGARLGSVTSAVLTIVEDDVPDPVLITTASLPVGQAGTAYNTTLTATGGVPPYTWSAPSKVYAEKLVTNSFAAIGTNITLQGDEGVRALALPFAFPFFGNSYTQCWIDINGKVRFDSAAGDYQPDSNKLVNAVMISVLWADLNTASGDVYVQTNAQNVTVRWAGTYYGGPAINFSLTLQADGVIRMKYGAGNTWGGMIGISGGTGTNFLFSSRNQAGSLSNAQDSVMYPAALPAGLVLATNGVLSGTPLFGCSNDVPFTVVDSWGATTSRTLTIVIQNPAGADSDGDGIPDAWELEYFGGLGVATTNSDYDGDHFLDWQECMANTNPTNRNSFLGIQSATKAAPGMVIEWSSVTGKLYRVERGTNLIVYPDTVVSNVPGIPPANTATDTTAVGSGPWYYRIKLDP